MVIGERRPVARGGGGGGGGHVEAVIPSKVRLYSSSIDLFSSSSSPVPASSPGIAYQTHSEHLPSL